MTDRLNLIETIAKEPKFSTFSRYMGSSNANAFFSRPGDFTVFVPTNDAFAKIPDDQMNTLLNEPGQLQLKALLSYHIVPGKIMAANIGAQQERQSVTGHEINFADYQGIKVNGVALQARNIEATNGVVHSLGTVLSPPALAGAQTLTSTVTAGASTPPIPVAGVSPIASAAPANQVPTAGSMAVTQKIPQGTTPLTLLTAKAAKPAKPIF